MTPQGEELASDSDRLLHWLSAHEGGAASDRVVARACLRLAQRDGKRGLAGAHDDPPRQTSWRWLTVMPLQRLGHVERTRDGWQVVPTVWVASAHTHRARLYGARDLALRDRLREVGVDVMTPPVGPEVWEGPDDVAASTAIPVVPERGVDILRALPAVADALAPLAADTAARSVVASGHWEIFRGGRWQGTTWPPRSEGVYRVADAPGRPWFRAWSAGGGFDIRCLDPASEESILARWIDAASSVFLPSVVFDADARSTLVPLLLGVPPTGARRARTHARGGRRRDARGRTRRFSGHDAGARDGGSAHPRPSAGAGVRWLSSTRTR